MANQTPNNVKLGVFVATGLLALILAFYMIGKNHNLFGANFELKARFTNLNGLIEGDNVLFSGIQAGTVKSINLINDTTIEVILMIDDKVRVHIHKNAVAAIGTEGLMGNKVVNILPTVGASPIVNHDDILAAQKNINTDEMLQTLSRTNNNIAVISEAIKGTVLRINGSALLDVLNDKSMAVNLKASLKNINKAMENASELTGNLNGVIAQLKKGKSAAGVLLTDTGFANNLKQAANKIKLVSDGADKLTIQLNDLITGINQDANHGKGAIYILLKDTTMAKNLKTSMDNVQKGTNAFNQDMEALKHNFLLRGYFKSQEKKHE